MKKSRSDSSLQKKTSGSVETLKVPDTSRTKRRSSDVLKVPDETRSNRSGSFSKRIKNSG